MFTSEQWGEWIYSGLGNGINMLWDTIAPILNPLIVSALIILVIYKIIRFGFYKWCRFEGDSKRLARKKTQRVKKVIDLASVFKDISSQTKK